STFMVEMTEAANILNNATENSLVLMDEIGRGTSTYDGLSLAYACALHLASRLKAFTLFATHYFELTTLEEQHANITNVHLDAAEHGDSIVFLHAVKPGPADRSYGLHVAALAGVPNEVIDQAQNYLHKLETQGFGKNLQEKPESPNNHHSANIVDSAQMPLFNPNPQHPAIKALKALNPDDLSPKQALDTLYHLKSHLNE
ncbi:MAG: DNA mismatch repair protein MutS, partial [Gammaproteobacteria bacterium]|nr:DNA mismatch repair protein MutS [Gammaproteobacteria bacterium]